jgi:hypothetical protein
MTDEQDGMEKLAEGEGEAIGHGHGHGHGDDGDHVHDHDHDHGGRAHEKGAPFEPFAPHVADPPRVDPETAPKPWIERPSTVRMLWMGSAIVLTLLVAADLFVEHHEAHFLIETSFGFSAWYGFVACVAMVVVSKQVVALFLKRKDTYYDGD